MKTRQKMNINIPQRSITLSQFLEKLNSHDGGTAERNKLNIIGSSGQRRAFKGSRALSPFHMAHIQ